MTSPWLVPVTALRRTNGLQRSERREGTIGELAVAGTSVPDEAPVVVDVTITSVSGGVEVTGTVDTAWIGECRRCLRPVSGRLSCAVRELYRSTVSDDRNETDEETYPLGVDHLDLEPLARDAVLLELPLAPLCKPECAGLCPVCGADRNDDPCGCSDVVADPRWAALETLAPGPESAD